MPCRPRMSTTRNRRPGIFAPGYPRRRRRWSHWSAIISLPDPHAPTCPTIPTIPNDKTGPGRPNSHRVEKSTTKHVFPDDRDSIRTFDGLILPLPFLDPPLPSVESDAPRTGSPREARTIGPLPRGPNPHEENPTMAHELATVNGRTSMMFVGERALARAGDQAGRPRHGPGSHLRRRARLRRQAGRPDHLRRHPRPLQEGGRPDRHQRRPGGGGQLLRPRPEPSGIRIPGCHRRRGGHPLPHRRCPPEG